ncbi:MAG: S41 family peptidase [Planctomycetia bacterium]
MPKRNLVILIAVTVGCLLAWLAREHDAQGRRFAEVLTAIERRYIEPVDREQLFEAAMEGMFASLDEHSGFLSGTAQDELNAMLDQEFGGVGLELAADGEKIVVRKPIARSPAWRAGVRAGDVVESVDGEPTTSQPLEQLISRLRGPPGTTVLVGLSSPAQRPDQATLDPTAARLPLITRSVRLTREQVEMESVLGDRRLPDSSWNWWIEGEDGVAIVRIIAFGERTASELHDALSAIEARHEEGLRGLVIDLRGNGGGLLDAAIDVCDLFLDSGTIVSTRDGSDLVNSTPASDGSLLSDVPIVVLIDGLTASAAEIVAACLQDHGRATIVGSRSYGKGTVQTLLSLSDNSATMKLTTAEYLRPSMASIHRATGDDAAATWGVSPLPEHEITPPRLQADAADAWRQARDAMVFADDRPPCCAAPSRRGTQSLPVATDVTPSGRLPREADPVLARGLELLTTASVRR